MARWSPWASAVPNVRGYAAGVRRTFESIEGRGDRLVRGGSSYQLNADPDELDLLAFSSHSGPAQRARLTTRLSISYRVSIEACLNVACVDRDTDAMGAGQRTPTLR